MLWLFLTTFLPFCCGPYSLWEEVHQSRWSRGSDVSVQTLQSQQRLCSVQAHRSPTQQEGEQSEQEQPECTGAAAAHTHALEHIYQHGDNNMTLCVFHRRLSSGCSHILLWSEIWWHYSTKNIRRYWHSTGQFSVLFFLVVLWHSNTFDMGQWVVYKCKVSTREVCWTVRIKREQEVELYLLVNSKNHVL